MDIKIEEYELIHQEQVRKILLENWGSTLVVSRGKLWDAHKLNGFVVLVDSEVKGLLTYRIEGTDCEIVTIDSLLEGKGIGTALIEATKNHALELGCKRLWAITANDNTSALKFYQKRDFKIAAFHKGAIEKPRKLKAQIPEIGLNNIPIRDEIELEIILR